MKKIKVLYLVAGFSPGGAELMLKKIILNLNQENFDISICFFRDVGKVKKLFNQKVKKIFCLKIHKRNVFRIIKGVVRLRKLIKNEKPQMLHCFMIKANLLGRFAAIGCNCKVISSIRVKLNDKKYLPILYLDRLSQIFVDIYMVNSKVLKNFTIFHGIKKHKIILIENGVDLEKFKTTKPPEKIKKELKLPNFPIITMIAHFRKQKDYPTMISAIAYLKNEVNCTFLAVGKMSTNKNMQYKINKLINKFKLDNVYLLGFRHDIPNILSITDIWVSSTLFEGQSNSLLEAMAMKKPIITTNIPENTEVVRNGKEALLIPKKSPKKMTYAIKKLLFDKDLAKNLAENAYRRIQKKYNINLTIKKLERFYNSLTKY